MKNKLQDLADHLFSQLERRNARFGPAFKKGSVANVCKKHDMQRQYLDKKA